MELVPTLVVAPLTHPAHIIFVGTVQSRHRFGANRHKPTLQGFVLLARVLQPRVCPVLHLYGRAKHPLHHTPARQSSDFMPRLHRVTNVGGCCRPYKLPLSGSERGLGVRFTAGGSVGEGWMAPVGLTRPYNQLPLRPCFFAPLRYAVFRFPAFFCFLNALVE
jgi:hypothetical protein